MMIKYQIHKVFTKSVSKQHCMTDIYYCNKYDGKKMLSAINLLDCQFEEGCQQFLDNDGNTLNSNKEQDHVKDYNVYTCSETVDELYKEINSFLYKKGEIEF